MRPMIELAVSRFWSLLASECPHTETPTRTAEVLPAPLSLPHAAKHAVFLPLRASSGDAKERRTIEVSSGRLRLVTVAHALRHGSMMPFGLYLRASSWSLIVTMRSVPSLIYRTPP